MKSELRLVRLVRTMSLRRLQSSTPSIATLALWPGAEMRRSAPFMREIGMGERFGLVAEQKHDVARLGLSLEQRPAQAGAVHGVRILAAF